MEWKLFLLLDLWILCEVNFFCLEIFLRNFFDVLFPWPFDLELVLWEYFLLFLVNFFFLVLLEMVCD